jgi:hypothetical protein
MVEQANMAEARGSLFRREAHQSMDTLVAQSRVRSKRHHEIKLFGITQNIDNTSEQKRQGQGTRMIGNQDKDALIPKSALESFVQDLDDLIGVKQLMSRSDGL